MGILREWQISKSEIPKWFEPEILAEISEAIRALEEYTKLIRASSKSLRKKCCRCGIVAKTFHISRGYRVCGRCRPWVSVGGGETYDRIVRETSAIEQKRVKDESFDDSTTNESSDGSDSF